MAPAHSCLVYDDEAVLGDAVAAFLLEGLRRNEQVGYFGWGSDKDLRRGLSKLADIEELVGRGALVVGALDTYYRRDQVPDATARLEFFADATARALAARYDALRVAVDTTPWLQLADQRAQFLR